MTHEEAYEKALDELTYVQFIDNTYSDGFRAKNEVKQLLAEFYKDMLQLILEKQTKVVELDELVVKLQIENIALKSALTKYAGSFEETLNSFYQGVAETTLGIP